MILLQCKSVPYRVISRLWVSPKVKWRCTIDGFFLQYRDKLGSWTTYNIYGTERPVVFCSVAGADTVLHDLAAFHNSYPTVRAHWRIINAEIGEEVYPPK